MCIWRATFRAADEIPSESTLLLFIDLFTWFLFFSIFFYIAALPSACLVEFSALLIFFLWPAAVNGLNLGCEKNKLFIVFKCCLSLRHAPLLYISRTNFRLHHFPSASPSSACRSLSPNEEGCSLLRGHTRCSYRSDLWLRALSKVHFGSGSGWEID